MPLPPRADGVPVPHQMLPSVTAPARHVRAPGMTLPLPPSRPKSQIQPTNPIPKSNPQLQPPNPTPKSNPQIQSQIQSTEPWSWIRRVGFGFGFGFGDWGWGSGSGIGIGDRDRDRDRDRGSGSGSGSEYWDR